MIVERRPTREKLRLDDIVVLKEEAVLRLAPPATLRLLIVPLSLTGVRLEAEEVGESNVGGERVEGGEEPDGETKEEVEAGGDESAESVCNVVL